MYRLKKSLGQHFLKDENIVHRIVEALEQHSFKNLLEVGPGGGALTKYLMQLPHVNFKAVELDHEKVQFLVNAYPPLKNRIINSDFLMMERPFDEPFTVIGNFPYNISTQILFKILEWHQYVPSVIGMFQKEVAQRAASKEGSKVYGVLSVLMQYHYKVDYLFDVGNEAFTPPPKVKSGVIKLTALENKFPVKSEKNFRTLVKAAFNQRRKTMRNAVRSLFPGKFLGNDLFARRAETFSVKEFAELTFEMGSK